jgi:hypothetical protein
MTIRCGSCHKPLESSETIHVAEKGPRCYPCFNRETADRLGVDFEEPRFQPIVLEDVDGVPHTFTFRSMLVPTGHEMEALELTGDPQQGYRFAILAMSKLMPGSSLSASTPRCARRSGSVTFTACRLDGNSLRTTGSRAVSNGTLIAKVVSH